MREQQSESYDAQAHLFQSLLRGDVPMVRFLISVMHADPLKEIDFARWRVGSEERGKEERVCEGDCACSLAVRLGNNDVIELLRDELDVCYSDFPCPRTSSGASSSTPSSIASEGDPLSSSISVNSESEKASPSPAPSAPPEALRHPSSHPEFSAILNLFSKSPKKAVQRLIDEGYLSSNPQSVAQFLNTCPELDKTAIGEYVGERDDFVISVLRCWIGLMDFAGNLFFVCVLKGVVGVC
jgi:hypothetical protein